MDPLRVNPLEGQVAIPSPRPPGYVVGTLGARAMVWVEQATGKAIDDIYLDIQKRMVATSNGDDSQGAAVFPVQTAAAVLWAAVEHERRRSHGPGPEFTVDDAYELIEHAGLDETYQLVITLLQLSLPFKKRVAALDEQAAAAGEPSPSDPLRAVATAAATGGTGNATSTPLSTPDYPPPTPGS